jgi:hypothetical protein
VWVGDDREEDMKQEKNDYDIHKKVEKHMRISSIVTLNHETNRTTLSSPNILFG